jgi:hypothetical protein
VTKSKRRRDGSPHHLPRRRIFRVSVALTPSRKVVRTSVRKETLKEGRAKDVSSSGEDEKLGAYYHNDKKFFLAI